MVAEHFPKENVMLNIFQRKMFSCAKMHLMRTFCFALQKCICNILCNKMYASNAFLHQQNVTNAFWRTFSKGKCSATRTFYEVKCSASHFPLENVQLCKNAFDAYILFCVAKMHL